MKRAVSLVVIMAFVPGCPFLFDLIGSGGGTTSPDPALRPFASAAELADFVNDQLDAQFGGRGDDFDLFDPLPLASTQEDAATGDAAPPTAGSSDEGDGNFSTTTLQEVGVDESDLVKNDGTYIYLVKESQARIIQAQPGESLVQVAAVDLEGTARALYLRENELIALSSTGGLFFGGPVILLEPLAFDGVSDSSVDAVAARAQSSDTDVEVPAVFVTVIDITDRAAPVVTRTVSIDGSLFDSRLIDGKLHLVIQEYPTFTSETVTAADVTAILPEFVDTGSDGTTKSGLIAEPTSILRPDEPAGLLLTTIATIDLDDPSADIQAIGVVGGAEQLYGAPGALYLATSSFEISGSLFGEIFEEKTDIHKIALTDAGPSYVGSGRVPGRPLDQFSFSEFDGFLRVATTSFDLDTSNNIFVLGEVDAGLEIVGELTGIAPGESIFSARFVGDRGFLVTFVRVDPLFTIDLSDPTNPTLVGELKVPGFSTFILPISENELLTIGRDADDDGVPRGIQLSIFDVSDFANPRLAHKVVLGLRGSDSEALRTPKALTWFPEKRQLAIPAMLVEAGDDDSAGGLGFSGLMVFAVDETEGFVELGRISTVDDPAEELDFFSFSAFTRGIFMNDDVFAVTPDVVRGAPVDDVDSVPYQLTVE